MHLRKISNQQLYGRPPTDESVSIFRFFTACETKNPKGKKHKTETETEKEKIQILERQTDGIVSVGLIFESMVLRSGGGREGKGVGSRGRWQ